MGEVKEEIVEKRGPIARTRSGWPTNPFGIVAIILILVIAAFLLASALKSRLTPSEQPPSSVSTKFSSDQLAPRGQLLEPKSGAVVKGKKLMIRAEAADEGSGVAAVEFWYFTYTDSNWQKIARIEEAPFNFEWDISGLGDRAVRLTMHVTDKAGNVTKDPGGWHEGILLIPSASR